MQRARYVFIAILFVCANSLCGISVVSAQNGGQSAAPGSAGTPSAQPAMLSALNAIQPLLSQVNLAASSVDVRRWKAPNDVRDTTAADVQSIQKDLNVTLPGLLDQAQVSPGSIAPAFAVFRNIDALYDVLLRITETATLAGTQSEAERLEQVRGELQARRAELGNAILTSATAQDNDVVQLRSSLQSVSKPPAQPAAPRKVVVDDGPAVAPARTPRKRKPTVPATAPATAPSATTAPQ